MDFFDEFNAITKRFNAQQIRYAVIGGIALSFYTEPRYTKDIDFLTIPSETDAIKQILEDSHFNESALPWTFEKTNIELLRFAKIEQNDFLPVDILVGKDSWHEEIVDAAQKIYSDQGFIRLISREHLIALKSIRASDQDLLDIKKLKETLTDDKI